MSSQPGVQDRAPAPQSEEETAPLLAEQGAAGYSSADGDDGSSEKEAGTAREEEIEVEDTMHYDTRKLTRWSSLFIMQGTVWTSSSLWWHILSLLLSTLVVAALVFWCVPDPVAVKVSRFRKISTFLNVFVGLLLGFFLSSSMVRWYTCVNGFLELLDAIRNMQMQMYALGASEERIETLQRYGVLSAWLLHELLHVSALPAEEQKEATAEMWKRLEVMSRQSGRMQEASPNTPGRTLRSRRGWTSSKEEAKHFGFDEVPSNAWLVPQEITMLKNVDDPPGMIWMWVGSLIGRMAQDGEIPPMASPTYGRIMNLAQDAHSGLRQIRASVYVQAPFVYVHMLAVLVHINNGLNAISFGLTVGCASATVTSRYRYTRLHDVKSSGKNVVQDLQDVLVSFFFSIVGPLLYQALLEISVCIASPFGSDLANIPTGRLLESLNKDLWDGKQMANCPPHWDTPSFKESQAKK